MQIKSSALLAELKKGLSPVIFLHGDEPLLIEDSHQLIRQQAEKNEYQERVVLHVETGFDWSSLVNELDALSLFSSKKLIELRMPNGKPGTKGSQVLSEYAKNNPSLDNILLITSQKLEPAIKKSAWYKAIDKAGLVVEHAKVYSNQLASFIQQRAKRYQLNLHSDAVNTLAYFFEGNLLSIDQTLKQLKLLHTDEQATASDVEKIVSDNSRFSTFALADSCLLGDSKASLHILQSLIREKAEPVLINWALQKEIRSLLYLALAQQQNKSIATAFQELRIWQSRQRLMQQALQRLSLKQLYVLHERVQNIDLLIKGASDDYRQGTYREAQLWHQFEKLVTLFSHKRANKAAHR